MIVVTLVDTNWSNAGTGTLNGAAMLHFYNLQDAELYAREQSTNISIPNIGTISVLVTVFDGNDIVWYQDGAPI